MKKKTLLIAGAIIVLGVATLLVVRWAAHRREPARELALFGNIELRQVSLPFNNSERIAAVLVDEGDRVRRGQVLARLDTGRLAPLVAQAEAQAAAQRQVVAKFRNGSRPEEIAQARSNLDSAKADAEDARRRYERLASLSGTSGVSQQDLDSAKAAADASAARMAVSQKALDLAVAGPRKEDIAEAEARLAGMEAQVASLRQELTDAELVAPMDAVVRTRIMEPGEMASPQKPVFTLAIIDPKWARAYVGEPDLGKVRPGMPASVTSDSFPGRPFDGQVGYLSSVAEFTPKTLQTEELRASLVYEVRVLVKDPSDELRLGMPVTVHLKFDEPAAATPPPKSKD